MDKILAPIKQRVLKYVDFKGFSKKDFFEKLEVSASNFRSKSLYSEINGDVLAKISSLHVDLNVNWLLTGKGEMLNSDTEQNLVIANAKNGVPLIPTDAIAGFGSESVSITDQDIMERYVVPDFVNVDFMIRVKGSSMYPKYNSGDVVACKMIDESSFIQWNKVHVISTREQGVLIKRLKKSKESQDHLIAISDNKDYEPFEIPKDEILNMALVTGVIRLE